MLSRDASWVADWSNPIDADCSRPVRQANGRNTQYERLLETPGQPLFTIVLLARLVPTIQVDPFNTPLRGRNFATANSPGKRPAGLIFGRLTRPLNTCPERGKLQRDSLGFQGDQTEFFPAL